MVKGSLQQCGCCRGITLLEVLISCALLVVGLTAIAGLVPAAGTRLAQASIEDRSAILLSNALADVASRGLVAVDAFPDGTVSPEGRAVVFGCVLDQLPALGSLPLGRESRDSFSLASSTARRRCGSDRTFVMEDLLVYDRSPYSDAPWNAFLRDATGLGPRHHRPGLCWGAMVSPVAGAPASGRKATLSIVIFRRGGTSSDGEPEPPLPLALRRSGTFYEAAITTAESLLGGCSWLLAMPSDPTRPARWFRIVTSWNGLDAGVPVKRLIMENQVEFADLTGSAATDSTAVVVAFAGIVTVSEQVVLLH